MTTSPADAPVAVQSRRAGGYRRRFLAVARIAVGLYFGFEAVRKISHGWLAGGSDFVHTVTAYPSARGGGFYHSFVTGLVLPHAGLFAFLVTLGECVAAVSLILGLLTRLGALIALWLNLNFLLLRGFANSSAMIDRAFLVANALFLVTAAGRTWGLDDRFRDTLARHPMTRWLAGARARRQTPATLKQVTLGAGTDQ